MINGIIFEIHYLTDPIPIGIGDIFMSFTLYRNIRHTKTCNEYHPKGAHNFYCHNVTVRNLTQFIFSVSTLFPSYGNFAFDHLN